MLQVLSTISVMTLAVFTGTTALAQTAPPPQGAAYIDLCASRDTAATNYYSALAAAKLKPNFGKLVAEAKECSSKDSSIDEDDDEFDCSAVEKNCPTLYADGEERVQKMKEDLRKEEKDLDKELNDEQKDKDDLKKEAAELAKGYAEQEDDLNEEVVEAEKDYKEALREKDREALEQVQGIQSKISEIANANREIVLKANRAMAELAASKLNAKKTCRETARADYQATLKQLDEELAKRGGKIAGGFEGIQNAEKYRKFLIAKIKNPEPSEQFTLCYSAGDAVETDLQQRNMGGALTMNEFASQIEENNKQRDQLSQQLQQQQQLAQQQKIEGYQEHNKTIQALQKKIQTNRQNFERESRALAEKQETVRKRAEQLRTGYLEAQRRAKNADVRYNCLSNNKLLQKDNKNGDDLKKEAVAAFGSLKGLCPTSNTCPACTQFNLEQGNQPVNSTPKVVPSSGKTQGSSS